MKKILSLVLTSFFIFAVFFIAEFYSHPLENEVVFFDVGQGDSALINLDDGLRILVDCGISKKILSKLGEYLPFYDRTIDYLIITHPDADHYGGCLSVLQKYKVKHIVLNTETKNDDYAKKFGEALEEEKAEIKFITHKEKWSYRNISFDFLSPDNDLGDFIGNDASLVFIMETPRKKILFTGDMENELEDSLLLKYCENIFSCSYLKSDILKVGHHGSDTSSSEDFLQVVNPTTAIISVGENSFGHPSLRTIRKLERLGSLILRTDYEGDIIIKDI